MKHTGNNKTLLRWLAIITAATLLGIIGLQVYWLTSQFTQQKQRFTADIENALASTVIKSQLAISFSGMGMGKEDSAITKQYAKVINSALSSLPRYLADGHSKSPTITLTDTVKVQDKELERLIHEKMKDSDGHHIVIIPNRLTTEIPSKPGIDLRRYKIMMAAELDSRAIQLPFEIAMLDSSGGIVNASCDTDAFKQMPLKYGDDMYALSNGNSLQVAFPDANLFLLRRMAWLLSISALLVVICTLSFTYLVVLFFRQKKLADMRNDFLNNMTHELKTPISSVSVAIELLQDTRYPTSETERQEYFAVAQSELKRLTMLVEKVLKMAAFEKSEIKIMPEWFEISTWLRDVVGGLRPLLESKDVELTTSIEPNDLRLHADKVHMTNVLHNLVENAIKYNDKEKPTIDINVYATGNSVIMHVTDNGKGISPAYQNKIFDKFFRVPSGDRHDTKGYGLGLSYVKAIVALHGGTISVQSKEHEGSTFTIELPINQHS